MNFEATIKDIGVNYEHYLTGQCVLALHGFLSGWTVVDSSVKGAIAKVAESFPGPSAADASTRAYLHCPNTRVALSTLLERLLFVLKSEGSLPPSPGPGARVRFMDFVKEPIMSGRTGMVFAEPTLEWACNFSNGYIAAMNVIDPSCATSEQHALNDFEAWLRLTYGATGAGWYGILRIYEGPCEFGLRRLVELWDEWRSGATPEGSVHSC